jgi:hypothetical protein
MNRLLVKFQTINISNAIYHPSRVVNFEIDYMFIYSYLRYAASVIKYWADSLLENRKFNVFNDKAYH